MILHVLLVVAVIGVLLWVFNNKVTIVDAGFKQLINVIVWVATVIWVLRAFNLLSGLNL